MSKANRLIELIERVKLKRNFTVQELADDFQVSYRTMLRYLNDISALGIPIYSVPGRKGGFKILEKGNVTKEGKVEITYLPRKTYIGYRINAPYTAKKETEILIPRLWIQLLNVVSSIEGVKQPLVKTALGLYDKENFVYYVTVEVDENIERIPRELTALSINDSYYAKKTHLHSLELREVIQTYEDIFSWSQNQNWHVLSDQFCLETFEEKFNPTTSPANFDIYVPVSRIK